MILAAGLGSRLFPLTIDRTKPAVPFLGRPLVGYVAQYLAENGFTDLVVNLHHQAESVRSALSTASEYGASVSYSEEFPTILGTGGAFRKARNLLGDEPFLAINGKIITDIDLGPIVDKHKETGALATMVLLPNSKNERFTDILIEEDRLIGFGGFPSSDQKNALLWTGIHILSPKVFDYIPDGEQDIISCFYRKALVQDETVAVHVADGLWDEMSTIERYLDASLAHLGGSESFFGSDCVISSDAKITRSVIWDRVEVGAGANLSRVVVTDDVRIPAGTTLSDCAVVSAESMRRHGPPPDKAPSGFFSDGIYIVPLEKKHE